MKRPALARTLDAASVHGPEIITATNRSTPVTVAPRVITDALGEITG